MYVYKFSDWQIIERLFFFDVANIIQKKVFPKINMHNYRQATRQGNRNQEIFYIFVLCENFNLEKI